jgi:hypothetical protein
VKKYGHAQFGWGGGMEHQTCVRQWKFCWNFNRPQVAHQWFWDKILQKLGKYLANEGLLLIPKPFLRKQRAEKLPDLIIWKGFITSAKTAKRNLCSELVNNINEIFNPTDLSEGATVTSYAAWNCGEKTTFLRFYKLTLL